MEFILWRTCEFNNDYLLCNLLSETIEAFSQTITTKKNTCDCNPNKKSKTFITDISQVCLHIS